MTDATTTKPLPQLLADGRVLRMPDGQQVSTSEIRYIRQCEATRRPDDRGLPARLQVDPCGFWCEASDEAMAILQEAHLAGERLRSAERADGIAAALERAAERIRP
jgi:hypothetical protein